ncbi:SDR family oxidoreductase [Saccharothrix sp. AJ9571]|nr:SDR family oxidoreductase [Saccharothrix sp. AJ9571]
MNLELATAVAVVTGSNRGLGRRFAEQLLARGAKVYATARRPEAVDLPGAIPLRLDLGDSGSIEEAARVASDATLLINNAGISTMTPLIGGDFADIRREMDTHYFGTLEVTRAFAPVLEANGGGAVLNVLSVLSWAHLPDLGAYSAAKTASWAMTNLVRQQLGPKGIHVAGLHVGYLDTDMAANVPADQKSDPGEVAALALDALAAGEPEIIADDLSRQAKATLSA